MQSLAATGLAVAASRTAAAGESGPHAVLELRQYKIVPGRRDEMVALFERHFVDSQDVLGMRLVGQFRDLDDPNRFTWIRTFPDMAARQRQLNAFYFGPVWQAHRGEANPLLDDNDNVLLLKPATPALAFAPPRGSRPATEGKGGMVVATILYLWKDPEESFSAFFAERMAPELAAGGLPVLGAYVAENAENTFPQLPVRQHEKVFVWFTRAADARAYETARRRLLERPVWRSALGPALADAQERGAQVLRLAPTPRSSLR
ncbi:MAG: NIPSNAP family protein [Alphaproteobacteria bacterium]|nr:NIPSNAP family protein [Alphaproteobacteria bacterium]MBU1513687.1 NIPSNAP family protein [Alphaproteobacteria bacterium]MBU2094668.1 NIPSNAP family protein [Alphaproteobacteria bacterium]MBU2150263.1 NIPSNAP family protein [Alphaproteobacteria bacterium]MBU2309208.1 NIPSNAP family protein [Alphaproteobacteria bacterium]